jgi:hypothetical protein
MGIIKWDSETPDGGGRHQREKNITPNTYILWVVHSKEFGDHLRTNTALCVAAARGMATVVKYLLSKGADQSIPCTGRFRLYTQLRRTVKCTHATPIEFAEKIRSEESAEGASEDDLKDLTKIIQYLLAACPAQSQRSLPGL